MSQWVPVSYRAREELWLPEISVSNMRDIKRLALVEEAASSVRVRGDKTVNTLYTARLSVRCDMDLRLYPHDVQVSLSVLSVLSVQSVQSV